VMLVGLSWVFIGISLWISSRWFCKLDWGLTQWYSERSSLLALGLFGATEMTSFFMTLLYLLLSGRLFIRELDLVLLRAKPMIGDKLRVFMSSLL
jgi:hypothetical protein